ncbi:hypothetical protein C8R45DRAFT_1155648, partial [Mycena sanguinolenta]
YSIFPIGFRSYGSETKLAADPIQHLFEVYTEIDTDKEAETASGTSSIMEGARGILRVMENRDPATLSLWHRFREVCVDAYRRIYARFRIEFDDYIGEAHVTKHSIREYAFRGLLNKTVLVEKQKWESDPKRNRKMPSTTDDAGNPLRDENPAWAVDLDSFKLGKPSFRSLVNDMSTYLGRDVAGAIQRFEEYQFEKMIYAVGEEHNLHFAQVFKILELMDVPFAKKLEHINFGKIKTTGTSKGNNFTSLEEILDMAKESMLSQVQTRFHSVESATNDEIGIACVKIQDMQTKRINSYTFDVLRMTSFEGDTGAYLQYVRTQLCALVASETILSQNWLVEFATYLLLEDPRAYVRAREITYILGCYPEVVRTAFRVSEPSLIVSYCFRLSRAIMSILDDNAPELGRARLLLFLCARFVLASGMRLLGLNPLERM